jgi:hypothetical protein
MKKQILATLACMGFAFASQAALITWNFQEDGLGDLGSPTKDFTESGITLTATSSGPNLYSKSAGLDETGLGLAGQPENEINPGQWIAFKLPTAPPTPLNLVLIGSVQTGESATVWWGATAGLKTTSLGTLTSGDGTVDISGFLTGYISVVDNTGNVLIDTVTATTPNVPDGGMTVALLGGALTLLGLARRKLIA